MVDQLISILNSKLTLTEIEELSPEKRQRLAALLEHWHQLVARPIV